MRIEGSYLTPVHGVSTLAPRNRMKGQAGVQKNFRSDFVNKLIRRQPVQWVRRMLEDFQASSPFVHEYTRDGRAVTMLADTTTGQVHCFVNDVFKQTVVFNAGYWGGNFVAQTIEDTVYMVNTDKVVERTGVIEATQPNRVSYISIKSALNYGESVIGNLSHAGGGAGFVGFTPIDLGDPPDYDAADKERATNWVANELADSINSGATVSIPGGDITFPPATNISASARGSTVAIWDTARIEWPNVDIASGQGDKNVVALNRVVESVDGLPLYALKDSRIEVKPDPTTDKGTYYLRAEPVDPDELSLTDLVEVVWVESRDPDGNHFWDGSTVPISIEYDAELDTFTLAEDFLTERQRGNEESSPAPDFDDKIISDVGVFQNRLVFIAGNSVCMSQTGKYGNFYKQSALQLLKTDTVSMSSSAVGTDRLKYIINHNRDMLIVASNGQFKIEGGLALTPESASMVLTTKYDTQVSAPPVAVGDGVLLPYSYGESTGIHEYTSKRNTSQDTASSITNHVVGLIQGDVKQISANSGMELVLVQTDISNNTLYAYEYYIGKDGGTRQQAWSEWEIAGDHEILNVNCSGSTISLLTRDTVSGDIFRKVINPYENQSAESRIVYLDDRVTLTVNVDDQVLLPEGYEVDGDTIVVMGDGPSNDQAQLMQIPYKEVIGNTMYFDEGVVERFDEVVLGKKYTSRYEPTRPFKRDDEGIVVTSDSIRVATFTLSLAETHGVTMKVTSAYHTIPDTEFAGTLSNAIIGEVPFYTGDVKFSFSNDVAYAIPEFYCEHHLSCNISGISWAGQYKQSSGRM